MSVVVIAKLQFVFHSQCMFPFSVVTISRSIYKARSKCWKRIYPHWIPLFSWTCDDVHDCVSSIAPARRRNIIIIDSCHILRSNTAYLQVSCFYTVYQYQERTPFKGGNLVGYRIEVQVRQTAQEVFGIASLFHSFLFKGKTRLIGILCFALCFYNYLIEHNCIQRSSRHYFLCCSGHKIN